MPRLSASRLSSSFVDLVSDKESQPVACMCRKPAEGFMIHCCNADCNLTEFHMKCVKMKEWIPMKVKWYCPLCRPRFKDIVNQWNYEFNRRPDFNMDHEFYHGDEKEDVDIETIGDEIMEEKENIEIEKKVEEKKIVMKFSMKRMSCEILTEKDENKREEKEGILKRKRDDSIDEDDDKENIREVKKRRTSVQFGKEDVKFFEKEDEEYMENYFSQEEEDEENMKVYRRKVNEKKKRKRNKKGMAAKMFMKS